MGQKTYYVNKMVNWSTIIGIMGMIGFVIYGYQIGIFTSQEALTSFMSSFGIWAPLVFILIQVIQVVIPILPGAVGCIAGVLIFGPIYGFIYNYVGICIGSLLAFLLSKRYGVAFVKSMTSEKMFEKYIDWLDKGAKFDKMFAIAIFLPVAPDDLLCYLAGLTKMTVKKFTAIIILGKPASIFLYSMGITSIAKLVLHFA